MNITALTVFRVIFTITFVMLTAVFAVASGAGSLDLSFNGTGYKFDNFGTEIGFDGGYETIVQPDGKILVGVAGYSLGRYNPDGSPDLTFGTGGKVVTTFGPSFIQVAADMALQPDGKIMVAGFREPAVGIRHIFIVRYNSNGTLDTAFGSNGTVTTVIDGLNCYAHHVTVQTDGKIVISGDVYHPVNIVPYAAIVRYNTDGTLDTSFDSDGIVTNHAMDGSTGSALAIQADGKVLIGGQLRSNPSSNGKFGLARYNADGSLDTGFDGDGMVATQMGPNSSVVRALEIMPDGRIIAGGTNYDSTTVDIDFALARYNPDGSLDASFDGDGKVFTHLTSDYDYLYEMAIQADGKIVATGIVPPYDITLLRYNTDGSLDNSYGVGGKAVINLGAVEYIHGLALDASGRAIVSGSSASTSTLIARITAEQSPLVDVGGRVTNANGQGISGISMVLTGADGVSRYALTNGFGYYVFPFVSSNEIYTVNTSSKRYIFLPEAQTVTLLSTTFDVDFTGTPNEGTRMGNEVRTGSGSDRVFRSVGSRREPPRRGSRASPPL